MKLTVTYMDSDQISEYRVAKLPRPEALMSLLGANPDRHGVYLDRSRPASLLIKDKEGKVIFRVKLSL